jgi:hypothetical protein
MSTYTFQGARIIAPVSFETDEILFVNNTLAMRQERVSLFGQRWKISFKVEPKSNADILVHMLPRLSTTFNFTVPQPDNPKLFTPLTGNVTDTATRGSDSFQTTTNLPSGRFIKFSNHSKVYMVLSRSDNTVTIYPSLELDLTTETTFAYGNNVTMQVFYDENQVRGITFENGVLSDPGTITLIENA